MKIDTNYMIYDAPKGSHIRSVIAEVLCNELAGFLFNDIFVRRSLCCKETEDDLIEKYNHLLERTAKRL